MNPKPTVSAWQRSADCTSLAPTGTKAGASTCNCAGVPVDRATRASRGSSSASKTICSSALASATLIPARYFERSDAPVTNPVVLREVARAQRIVEGQNFEIRRTLAHYSAVVEEQHRLFIERRRAILLGETAPRCLGA